MAYEIKRQILISEKTQYGDFIDAINISEADYNQLSAKNIDDLVAQRVAQFIDIMANPVTPVPPTKEELEEEVSLAKKRLEEAEEQLASVQQDIDTP